MQLIDATNAADYLRRSGHIAHDESVAVQELPGGVSNVVLRVCRSSDKSEGFILKQARPQLRVPEAWYCSVERNICELGAMRICQRVLSEQTETAHPRVTTPRVLFEDRKNYLFAMTAAPHDHTTWKNLLLAGRADLQIAAACGSLLAAIHCGTWNDPQVAQVLGEPRFFDDLRIDPYYRQIARIHSGLAPRIDQLIQSLGQNRYCLVHGDFSPKNLLVSSTGLMLVDFEVGHFGDPAFDLGFFLSHLILKAFYHQPSHEPFLALTDAFWHAYRQKMEDVLSPDEDEALMARAIVNFAACSLARIDGKSKVEYLTDSNRASAVRSLATRMLEDSPEDWAAVLRLIRIHLDRSAV
jgi:5-methylthioribose kinase